VAKKINLGIDGRDQEPMLVPLALDQSVAGLGSISVRLLQTLSETLWRSVDLRPHGHKTCPGLAGPGQQQDISKWQMFVLGSFERKLFYENKAVTKSVKPPHRIMKRGSYSPPPTPFGHVYASHTYV